MITFRIPLLSYCCLIGTTISTSLSSGEQLYNLNSDVGEVKNLTISGKLAIGTVVKPNVCSITTAGVEPEKSFFTKRDCTAPLLTDGFTITQTT